MLKCTLLQKKLIYIEYFGENHNIKLINDDFNISNRYALVDKYMNSILRRISHVNFNAFIFFRSFVDMLRKFLGSIIYRKISVPEYDVLMRDYNLQDTISLSFFQSKASKSKICIFPHSTAIQSDTNETKKNPPKIIPIDLFLENTDLSTKFSKYYKETFIACGSPQIEEWITNNVSLFDPSTKNILFLTRNCDPTYFGITYEDCGEIFENTLKWARNNNVHVYVKHHPRDNKINYWRDIQSNFENVTEYKETLNNFNKNISFAFCLYTSACLLLSARGVPVFDVSRYQGDVDKLPFHYIGKSGNISHELIEFGMCGQIINLDDFFDEISEDYLLSHSNKQLAFLKNYFPTNSYSIIDKSLKMISS